MKATKLVVAFASSNRFGVICSRWTCFHS